MRYNVIAKHTHTGFHPRLKANQTIPKNLLKKFMLYCPTEELDAENEEIIQTNVEIDICLQCQDLYWNAATEEFQTLPPP